MGENQNMSLKRERQTETERSKFLGITRIRGLTNNLKVGGYTVLQPTALCNTSMPRAC